MQSQWLRFASSIKLDGHEPNFSDLKRFIVNEADVAKSSYASALCQRSKRSSIPRVVSHSTLVSDQKKRGKPFKMLVLPLYETRSLEMPRFLANHCKRAITVYAATSFMR